MKWSLAASECTPPSKHLVRTSLHPQVWRQLIRAESSCLRSRASPWFSQAPPVLVRVRPRAERGPLPGVGSGGGRCFPVVRGSEPPSFDRCPAWEQPSGLQRTGDGGGGARSSYRATPSRGEGASRFTSSLPGLPAPPGAWAPPAGALVRSHVRRLGVSHPVRVEERI